MSDIVESKKAIEYLRPAHAVFKMLHEKMDIVEELVGVLEVFDTVTVALQKRGTTLSDFYGFWLIIEHKLKQMLLQVHKTNLAKYLLEAMQKRQPDLFETPVMTTAIFLDPRYRHTILNDERKVRQAKLTICNVWEKIKHNKPKPITTPTDNVQIGAANSTRKFAMQNLYAELNAILDIPPTYEPTVQSQPDYSKEKSELLLLLDDFNPPRMRSQESVIKFWADLKEEENAYHEITEVALVVMAIPPSEIETERDMSALSFIFTELRNKMDENLLEDILLIYLNKDLFNQVKAEQISEILNEQH